MEELSALGPVDVFEERSIAAFTCIGRVEKGLRRAVEDLAPKRIGPKWTKALPDELKGRIGDSLDGLYLGDLRTILSRFWKDLALYPESKKQETLRQIESIEGIRNDVAHYREISVSSMAIVYSVYYQMEPLLLEYLAAPEKKCPEDLLSLELVQLENQLGSGRPVDRELVERVSVALGHGQGGTLPEAVRKLNRLHRRPAVSPALRRKYQLDAIDELATIQEHNS